MDFSEYLDPNFDPSTLRVVDLRRILNQNNITWSSRHRKSDLIDIFNYQLIPLLKRNQTNLNKIDNDTSNNTISDNNIQNPLNNLIIKKRENLHVKTTPQLVINKKRKRIESADNSKITNINNNIINDTKLHDYYSKSLQKNIKKKRIFSDIEKPLKKKRKINIKVPQAEKSENIFNRNKEIKFDLPLTKNNINVNPIAN
ncbi:hypothetical protein C6P40_004979, partial [Pichia californica]